MCGYSAYGLHITAQTPIAGLPIDQDATNDADLTILDGTVVEQDDDIREASVLAQMNLPPGADYVFVRNSDGTYLLRYRGVCDFLIDQSLRVVTVHLKPDPTDPGASRRSLADLLLVGAVPSFVLTMRGEVVLHASAVEQDGRALAFVGYSGMGKSTMAALMCADGARLITDDVLRLIMADESITCALGVGGLRLRKSAGELSSRFTDAPERQRSADARDVLTPVPSGGRELPLTAIVIPFPRRDIAVTSLQRLTTMDAVLLLARYPRLLGWEDPGVLERQFEQLVTIAERVPCFTADVPWGPPFAPDLGRQLTGLLNRELSRRTQLPAT